LRLKAATVKEIEDALHQKYPELKPEDIDRIIRSLKKAGSDPSFEVSDGVDAPRQHRCAKVAV